MSSPIVLTEEDIAALEALQATATGEELMRVRVVMLTAKGWASGRIAEALGMARGSVKNLRTRFRQGGVAGLRSRPHPGREPKLANAVAPIVDEILSERPIKAWSAPRLCEEVARRGGPAISMGWMLETLKKRVPRHLKWKQVYRACRR